MVSLFSEKRLFQTTCSPQAHEFMNFMVYSIPAPNILIIQPTASICCKKRRKNTLHLQSDGFDVWPQNPDSCQWLWSSREVDTHTQSGPGLICGDHCTDPDQIRCQSTKLPSFPLVVAVWEWRQPPTSLRTAGLKGESHAWLIFRPDQKECNLGLGRQQSLSAQQQGFGGEDPKHQIASGKTRFSQ